MTHKKIGWLTVDDFREAYRDKEDPRFTFDDYLAVKELRAQGYEVVPVDWRKQKIPDLAGLDCLIVRTPQSPDFLERIPELVEWMRGVEKAGIPVMNPPGMCLWNSDKRYLLDLAAAGADVVPLDFIGHHVMFDLQRYMDRHHYDEVVVKPAISIGGYNTYRVRRDTMDKLPALSPEEFDRQFPCDGSLAKTPTVSQFGQKFRALLSQGEMIVSPYVPQIEQGEWSFVFFNGEYSHAVRKEPAEGNFLIHVHHKGTINTAIEPPEWMVDQAKAAFSKIGRAYGVRNRGASVSTPFYARLDGVEYDNKFRLLEVELFEPMLYFSKGPQAVHHMIDALAARLEKRGHAAAV